MKPLRRAFASVERRPGPLAIAAGLGFTLLVASAVAVLGPPDLLDTLVAMGDGRLYGSLAILFVASACAARIAFRRRPRLEEDLDDIVLAAAPAKTGVPSTPPEVAEADRPAKAYLR
ncbi:MAG: hypothetical protein ACJ79D_09175 [Myxococcales bacterium]